MSLVCTWVYWRRTTVSRWRLRPRIGTRRLLFSTSSLPSSSYIVTRLYPCSMTLNPLTSVKSLPTLYPIQMTSPRTLFRSPYMSRHRRPGRSGSVPGYRTTISPTSLPKPRPLMVLLEKKSKINYLSGDTSVTPTPWVRLPDSSRDKVRAMCKHTHKLHPSPKLFRLRAPNYLRPFPNWDPDSTPTTHFHD